MIFTVILIMGNMPYYWSGFNHGNRYSISILRQANAIWQSIKIKIAVLEFRYKDQKKCIFFQKYRNLLFLDYIFTIPPE